MFSVKKYQTRLKELGFDPGVIDGKFGPNTKRAILAFQRSVGISADGVVGPITWSHLFKEVKETKGSDELPWMYEAYKMKGYHEVKNKSALFKWLKSDGMSVGDPSRIPWCGDFVETAIKLGLPNEPFTGNLAKNPYWARNWAEFGREVKPQYGAVLVFTRGSGGHVGFYVGESGKYYSVLGGNQSNAVTISRIAKNRCIGVRWPTTYSESGKVVTSNAGSISTNEA